MFQAIGNFFKDVVVKVKAVFSNQVVNTVWHAALGGVATFVTNNAVSDNPVAIGFNHPTYTALGVAAIGGIIGWARGTGNPTAAVVADMVQKKLDEQAQARKTASSGPAPGGPPVGGVSQGRGS